MTLGITFVPIFTDVETKAQAFWAGACIHTRIIRTLGMGLRSGASGAPVNFNQVPWGWVFVHPAFTSHACQDVWVAGDPPICEGPAGNSFCD